MNRILKRPMFRIGGSPAEGITSGLDKPEMKMASADMDNKLRELREAFLAYKQQGGTLSFEEFSAAFAEENFNSGGRVGYQTGGFSPSGLPGFLTQFGLNLLSQPPQGGLLSTAAIAAREPFNTLQASQLRKAELEGERAFQTELADKEAKAAMERLETKIASDERIADAAKELTVNELAASVLGDYQNDLNKATNHAKYFLIERPKLAEQYGETQQGGLIELNLNDAKSIQRAANLKKKDVGKIFFELNTGSVLKLIKDPATDKLTFSILSSDQVSDDTGEVLNTTADTTKKPDFTFLSPGQKKTLEKIQEEADPNFGIGFYD